MKKTCLLLFFALVFSNANSQCENLIFNNKTYPGICISNAIKWFNMSRQEWSSKMETYDFSDSGYSDGAPFYSSGVDLNDDGILYAITKDFGLLTIENSPLNEFKINIFKKIVVELEPYFIERKGNMALFRFKYSGDIYQFGLSQSSDWDMLFIGKL